MRITEQENRDLAGMMLQESYHERRARETAHRALSADQQPPMVVCFGAFDYKVIWVAPCGGEKGRQLAEEELAWWQQKAQRGGLTVLPLHRDTLPHEFDVRTQADLDHLTRAIMESYA